MPDKPLNWESVSRGADLYVNQRLAGSIRKVKGGWDMFVFNPSGKFLGQVKSRTQAKAWVEKQAS